VDFANPKLSTVHTAIKIELNSGGFSDQKSFFDPPLPKVPIVTTAKTSRSKPRGSQCR
jgi:hypothetical protein